MALIKPWNTHWPRTDGAFVAENATLIGDITLSPESSVWYGAVLRADVQPIFVGARSNVQDLAMIHASTGRTPTTIGDDVTIGHGAILHGCTIGNNVLVGMGAVILDDAVVPDNTLVAARALVTERAVLESGWLYAGVPAKKLRLLTPEEIGRLHESAMHYVAAAVAHFGHS